MHLGETSALLSDEREGTVDSVIVARAIRKLDRRLLLLLTGVVFFSYVDRSNIGYAARDLCNALELTHEEYGLGVSLFYAGYLVSQVAGNVLLKKLGTPLWMALMMFSWGCVATSLGFIQNIAQFYVLRVLLGVAEGGTFPAIFHILAVFYPAEHVSGAYTVVMSAVSFSMPLSSPISAGLLSLGGHVGVTGWRLLFIVEGLLPIAYTLVLYMFLTESPEASSFLDAEEKAWIASKLEPPPASDRSALLEEIRTVLSRARWWLCTVSCMLIFAISNVLMSWATLIIHDMLYGEDEDEDEESKTCGSEEGNSALSVLITAIPFLFAGLLCLAARIYGTGNRAKFVALVASSGGVTLAVWSIARKVSRVLGFVLLTCSIASGFVTIGPLTALALEAFDISTHSTASSLYNMFSCIGGFVFPPVVGWLIDEFGYGVAVAASGGVCILAAILVSFVSDPFIEQEGKTDREIMCHEQPSV